MYNSAILKGTFLPKKHNTDWTDIKKRLKYTFFSILIFNWILVIMGIIAFSIGAANALGGEFDIAALFGILGTADVISLFAFSMDRVQRNLGDQFQVQTAYDSHLKQMDNVKVMAEKLMAEKSNTTIDDTERLNEEIRRATLISMELIQDFTKIAEPLKEKPWLRALPIRYSPLKLDGNPFPKDFPISKSKKITLSGTIKNVSNKKITLNKMVIAVRPPHGTPDGGPWRFDFHLKEKDTVLKPKKSKEIEASKAIEINMKTGKIEPIPDEWFTKDWYIFMTCQTKEDGCWHDDHNKYWFELKKQQ